MIQVVETLTSAFAPWQKAYSDSSVISTAVTATHIVSLLVGGGLAIGADRTTLRALKREAPDWQNHLAELHAVHRPVVWMLVVLFISGLAMATADIETFATSPLFWLKLALVTLLLVNGYVLYRTEGRLLRTLSAPLLDRLKLTTYLSLLLWVLTTVAGVVLTNA
ncbi:MAG TPA: hypothetical protein VM100_10290 [Longimicrobiales bacterium]|nr:hypothetical protein [Longimicrobiales bacterium]